MFRLLVAALLLIGCKQRGEPTVAPAQTERPDPEEDRVLPGLVLPESERKHLAEVEHRGLILARYGFPRIADPLSHGVNSALARVFSPTATGALPPVGEASGSGSLRIMRYGQPRRVARAELAGSLLRLLGGDGPDTKVKFMLRGLAPVDRQKYDGAWRGSAKVRVNGATPGGEIWETYGEVAFEFARIPEALEMKAAVGWVNGIEISELTTVRSSGPLFEETTAASGLLSVPLSDNWDIKDPMQRPPVPGGVYTSDVDRDGWIDVLVTDRGAAIFYRGRPGGKFEEATVAAGLGRKPKSVNPTAFADLDGDGLPDLILGDLLFRNAGEGRFEDVTDRKYLFNGEGMGVALLDYDLDGRLDVYLYRSTAGVMGSSWLESADGPGNQLWRNMGGWRFQNVTHEVNATAGRRSVFATAVLDANNDGRPDLYVINEFGPGVLLINGEDRFTEVQLESDDGDFGTMGLTVGDIDNDGLIDIYAANMYSKAGRRIIDGLTEGFYEPDIFKRLTRFITGSELYRQTGDLKFKRLGAAARLKDVGWAYGPAFVDVDNDGLLDLYATCGYSSVSRSRPDG